MIDTIIAILIISLVLSSNYGLLIQTAEVKKRSVEESTELLERINRNEENYQTFFQK